MAMAGRTEEWKIRCHNPQYQTLYQAILKAYSDPVRYSETAEEELSIWMNS